MTTRKPGFPFRTAVLACCVVLASGCASTPRNPDDPLEGYNRAMFTFNEKVDKAVLKPVAEAYDYVTPKPVKIGVGNFFSNLADPWIGLNNLLQGKPAEALSDWMRFMVNTVFGFAGLLDIASEAQLPKHDEDFGQTLAVWGVGEGPYFVVPFFGPRTVRDAAVLPGQPYRRAGVARRPRADAQRFPRAGCRTHAFDPARRRPHAGGEHLRPVRLPARLLPAAAPLQGA